MIDGMHRTPEVDVGVASPAGATPAGDDWYGHPRGLSTLFFTEMWERFSYYGMRALLVLFMTDMVANGGLGLTDVTATAIYGLYTFGVYAVALPGGWIADRLTGQRRAVLWGGVVIAVGHLTLAIPTVSAFSVGLVLIVLGTGLLKPNVSAIVADLYPEGGARRDAGFSVYYMGINVGALVGPIVCGYLGENVNWHLGFSAAGIGMSLGVVQYVRGWRHLGDAGALRATPEAREKAWRTFVSGVGVTVAILLVLIGVRALGWVTFSFLNIAQGTGAIITVLVIAYFAYVFAFGGLTREEARRVAVIPLLFVAAAVFWSGFEQAGSSMNLFADRLTDRDLLGWEIPATWLQSVNPLFIIALAPVAGAMWLRLGSRAPSLIAKFAYGLVQLGLGFFVLAWASVYTEQGELVSPTWLVVTYFFHTTGELCLSPVGLSGVTKLSPKRFVGQMMGIWFMAGALGNLLAGLVAGLIESLALPRLFGAVGLIVVAVGLVMAMIDRPVARLTGES